MVLSILTETTIPLKIFIRTIKQNILLNNSSSNANITSEWTFMVNIATFNSFLWSLETQTNISVISCSFYCLTLEELLSVKEDGALFLICSMILFSRLD